jgi:hypothetical protein
VANGQADRLLIFILFLQDSNLMEQIAQDPALSLRQKKQH